MYLYVLFIIMVLMSIADIAQGTPVTNSNNMTNVDYVVNGVNTKLVGPLTIATVITVLGMILIGKYIKEHHDDISKLFTKKKRRSASVIGLPPSPAAGRCQGHTGNRPDVDTETDVGDVTELIDMPATPTSPNSIDADLVSLRAFLAATDAGPKSKDKEEDAAMMSGANGPGSANDIKAKIAAVPRHVTWGIGLDLPSSERPLPRGHHASRRSAPRSDESGAGPSGTSTCSRKDEGPNFVFF